MAEAVVSNIAKSIGNLLVEEGQFLLGVHDQTSLLLAELKQLKAFLADADARQNDSNMVREWVSQIRDLAYEAENLLEHYAFKAQSRKGTSVTHIIKRCFCLLDEGITRHEIGSGIKSRRDKISELARSFDEWGVRSIIEKEEGPSSRQQLRRTYSNVIEEDLVGVESQVKLLVENLIGEDHKVVALWGTGGLGKTTLAKKVYHHPKIRDNFEVFSWVCVSQQWQMRDLLEGIMAKFFPTMEKIKDKRDDELIRHLHVFQQNHKCLVVLDDVWATDVWGCIRNAFPIAVKGSKLLVTTRKIEVASSIDGNPFMYQPRLLTDKESWELLRRKFLIQAHTQDRGEAELMETLGKDMVKHCGGLPLGVLVLGGILAKKHKLWEWEIIHKSIKSYIVKGGKKEDQEKLRDILVLSYNDLPYKLKPCFLYLSKYKEDAEIETESLYQIWMAEGMVSVEDQIGDETMMEVAERYLCELEERCMVSIQGSSRPSITRFQRCRLHDVMRELCLLKAKEENFLVVMDKQWKNGTDPVDSSFSTPRIAISFPEQEGERDIVFLRKIYDCLGKYQREHLRSFTMEFRGSREEVKRVFHGFKMLRVLCTEGLHVEDDDECSYVCASLLGVSEVHLKISSLIHLRYLCLGDTIPSSSIGKLKHLQTLKMGYFNIVPNDLWKLKQLKHLYLPVNGFRGKLRLDGFHNLEILHNFDSRNTDVKSLSTLTNLRSLKATISEKLEELEEFMSIVNKLTFLRVLHLQVLDCDFCSEKGPTLLREVFSWNRLNGLGFYGLHRSRISKLPKYELGFLRNLYELRFWTEMEEDPMSTLEKLPNLRDLSLAYSFSGEEMLCHATGFPQLKTLSLHYLENLNSWSIEEGAMPNLYQLQISGCQKLKMIPDGLRSINTLKELHIHYMPEEFKSRLQIRDGQEGEDFDKVRHVPSIRFHV